MNIKNRLLITISFCLISRIIIAQPINLQTAVAIAEHHLEAVNKPNLKSANITRKNFHITSVRAEVENKDTLYYILKDTINQGFVIVSADKRAWPILGYSTEGSFDEKHQPEAFKEWMDNRKKEIEEIKKKNIPVNNTISASWENLSLKSSTVETPSVEPLLQTKWDQGCYYNSMCPEDPDGQCGHVYTGCVATAMAQIMKYWNYPTKGKGTHSYLNAGYGVLKADFGSTTYKWSQMTNEVTSQNDAVAELMLHCGISVNMEYGPSSSGSYDPKDELVEYFDYSPEAENVDMRSYSESDWISLLKTELDYGRPIWYQGANSLCYGVIHAFVCDGYQNTDYFHFNWGWGGSYDGYYYLGNLNPFLYFFSTFQSAIVRLFPNRLPDGYNGIILSTKTVGFGIKGGTAKISIKSSKEWNAISDQSWLTITPNIGTSDSNSISFNATANPTTNIRTANVIISAPGLASQTIIVTQYGKFEVSAGNLKTVLSNQLSTITSLSISGTIDARDFKTMRNEMPALAEVDLRDVSIIEYTGYDGTIPERYTYSANEIPRFAFGPVAENFYKIRLKTVLLPYSITSIDDYAFIGCKNLTIEEIPSKVTSIGDLVFNGCNGSPTLIIPQSVTFIGDGAFNSFNGSIKVDKNNPKYTSIDGVLFNKNRTALLQCPVSKEGDYVIPSTVTSIGNCGFINCKKLTSIKIPSSVDSIKQNVFINCTGLTTLSIPSSVIFINQYAFNNCSGYLFIDDKNPNYSAVDGVFFNKNQTELIDCPEWKAGTYTIPSTVTTIGDMAFDKCDSISTIIIPSSVKHIGSFSFYCAGLSSIYAYSVSPIDLSQCAPFHRYSFTKCTLYVPYGTKSLYAKCDNWGNFEKIVEFKQPEIVLSTYVASIRKKGGSTVVNISSSEDWSAYSDQNWLTITPETGSYNTNTITLTAPANPTALMRKATVTLSAKGLTSQTIEVIQYGNLEVTTGNLKSILSDQLSSTKDLTLTGTIDARDFKTMRDDMPLLEEIDLSDVTIKEFAGREGTRIGSDNITYLADEIPDNAFFKSNPYEGKYSLKSIIFPKSVKSIGSFAFGACTGIARFTIPSTVTRIDDQAFFMGNGLINVETDNSNYSSDEGVLYNKAKTVLMRYPGAKSGNYIIPSTVKTINEFAFAQCDSLTSMYIPSSVTTIGPSAFFSCNSLQSVDIPSSLTNISAGLFSYCYSLTSIEIPSTVINIGNSVFCGCSGLNSIIVYSKNPINLTHSTDVFAIVDRNTCILYVPYGTKSLYSVADQWEDFFNIVEMPNETSDVYDVNNPKKLNIFPNPTKGIVEVSTDGLPDQSYSVDVYNEVGEIKLKGEKSSKIDLSSFPKGIYLLKINSGAQCYMQKIIKE